MRSVILLYTTYELELEPWLASSRTPGLKILGFSQIFLKTEELDRAMCPGGSH